jgi:organic hydroperoxide reductase OsmC/OhrA
MPSADIREYTTYARSTDTFGRVLCNARNHHFIVDGPVPNGCPGEEVTPSELFLSAVASCGVELVQVLAKQQDVPLPYIDVAVRGLQDRANPARPDYSVFNSVHLRFRLRGVSQQQAVSLIEAFKRR